MIKRVLNFIQQPAMAKAHGLQTDMLQGLIGGLQGLKELNDEMKAQLKQLADGKTNDPATLLQRVKQVYTALANKN